jgi:hypothetical protein
MFIFLTIANKGIHFFYERRDTNLDAAFEPAASNHSAVCTRDLSIASLHP